MDARVQPLTASQKRGKPRHVARHLFHGDCGYYARMAVPHALRPIVGKKEFWTAIHAESDARAVRKLPTVVAGFHADVDAARAQAKAARVQAAPPRAGRSLSPRQLAAAHYNDQMQFDDELRNSDHRYSQGFVDSDYVERLRRVANGAADNVDSQEVVGWIVRKYQSGGNLRASFGTPEWRASIRALAVAELESLARTAERDEGDFKGQSSHPLLTAKAEPVATKDPLSVRIIGPDSTKVLSEFVPDFVKERGAGPQQNHDCKTTVRMFEEHLGDAKPIYSITRQDVRGFARALSDAPASSTKRFPGLTFPEAIKANKARATPFPLLNPRTINEGYLSRLHSIFNWCKNNDVIPDNPVSGIKVEMVRDKGKPRRVPFSPSDLTKIFSPERFDTSKPFDEQRWAELSALFTGARASELAQVKLDSIRHERGSLVVAIEEETKNGASQRLIPIHSTLIALGFEKRVAKLRASGASHLFPVWYRKGIEAKQRAEASGKVTLNHHFPRFIPRAFKVTILANVGINDPRKTFHSFRHTFKTGLRNAGVEKSMRDDLCGHADNSAGAGYEHGQPIEAMKAAIEKLRFDGFGFAA
jgi:integrase